MSEIPPIELSTERGEPFQLYATGPQDTRRAILLIHDFWGVRPYNLHWAQRLAELGYRAAVVDLYDGQQPADRASATAAMRAVDQDQAERKLAAALQTLSAHGRMLATLGWSFGGLQSFHATLQDPKCIAATVFIYSRVLTDPALLARLNAPVLGVYSRTERTWPEKQEQFEAAMQAAGKIAESVSFYADHGFVNPDSPRYDAPAAEGAWQAVSAFLGRHLC